MVAEKKKIENNTLRLEKLNKKLNAIFFFKVHSFLNAWS